MSLNCFGQWISINEPKYSAKAQFFSFSLNSFVVHNVLACASLLKSFSSCHVSFKVSACWRTSKSWQNDQIYTSKMFDYHEPALSASGRWSLSGLLPFWEESRTDLLHSRCLLCWSSCTRQTGTRLKSLEVSGDCLNSSKLVINAYLIHNDIVFRVHPYWTPFQKLWIGIDTLYGNN